MPKELRVRREPPRYRRVAVTRTEMVTPRLVQVTLGGRELEGLEIDEPAASVRLLLPSPGSARLVLPAWTGNEFLLRDGSRPAIRTFTPRNLDSERGAIDVYVVLHEHGVASDWARRARPGDPAALSGPGRGYTIDRGAASFLLAGDETAIPAIAELLVGLPSHAEAGVVIEVADATAIFDLPDRPLTRVDWIVQREGAAPGDGMFAAFLRAEIGAGTRVWAAGEAAAVQRIRNHLFRDLGMPRSQATVRGYWKHGRRGA